MNRLSITRRTQVIGCLVEGNSIRSAERITDTHRDTIMCLMVKTGGSGQRLLICSRWNRCCRDSHWFIIGWSDKPAQDV